eukprot:185222-Chlamydomonas_euryale.AAC.1
MTLADPSLEPQTPFVRCHAWYHHGRCRAGWRSLVVVQGCTRVAPGMGETAPPEIKDGKRR